MGAQFSVQCKQQSNQKQTYAFSTHDPLIVEMTLRRREMNQILFNSNFS